MAVFKSKSVLSNQNGTYEKLAYVVEKHIRCHYQKPIQVHNQFIFDMFLEKRTQWLKAREQIGNAEFILDSCCGTGRSSIQIANENPNSFVVGLDQSAHRIAKGEPEAPTNLIFLQGNCEDFWRLCVNHNIKFDRHYILYPNPYPKAEHFKRRWHGHPVFPYLKGLAPKTELRSNWSGYLLEFSQAWQILTGKKSEVKAFVPKQYLTLFERKYAESGQELFRLQVDSVS